MSVANEGNDDMRAEEGDETVRDYAAEGKQTHDRIKDAQRAQNPVGRLVQRISRVFRRQ